MKTYYLIYVYRGEIKMRECRRSSLNRHVFEPVNSNKYYHTSIPDLPEVLQHGKIYCETLDSVPDCVKIIKEHYKDRVLQLEKSILLGKQVIGGEVK